MAAFAALAAALIAFLGLRKQVQVSQSTLDHQRQDAKQLAWWRTFEWASSRALPSGERDIPLPHSVTIRTLERLVNEATTKVQEAACSGVIDVLSAQVLPVVDEDVNESATEARRDSSAAVEALVSYVEASGGTAAASARAEAAVYEPRVAAAMYEGKVLAALSALSADIRVFREPPISNSRTDAVAEVSGRPVAVEISFARTPMVVRARARSAAQQRREIGAIPLVLVSRFESPFSAEEETELRLVVARWNLPADNGKLLDALRRASDL
ncbi:hypothetical protein [Frigoribacterium sp. CFBP 8751]|uniref:hypothetical protein n=1 Tax=Frigoribacterium sp. CFBP 8751 TaxID=2775277 RepID=UPI00177B295F|nr:hypothetical protein [Frigoribacterium sp. CFBP 8751]MBD8538049.1 hypothetical protein [Frigoribacterium sp. CFBP 8751]